MCHPSPANVDVPTMPSPISASPTPPSAVAAVITEAIAMMTVNDIMVCVSTPLGSCCVVSVTKALCSAMR